VLDVINRRAESLFIRTADDTVQNAIAAGTDRRTGMPINVPFMNQLRNQLRSDNDVVRAEAVATIIDKLQPYIPPARAGDVWP
jgi:hypothetical protein